MKTKPLSFLLKATLLKLLSMIREASVSVICDTPVIALASQAILKKASLLSVKFEFLEIDTVIEF